MIRTSARLALASALGSLVLVAGCTPAPGTPAPPAPATQQPATPAAALLAKHGLAGKTAEQVVETLDADPRPRPLALKASVRSDEVLLDDGTAQATLPLTADRFYLSIAPYQSRTHECHFHNLGTCQGELAGRPVHVTITDRDGTKLVDADATTYANGFVGFWIPKNTSGTVRVSVDGRVGETPFDSRDGGATCVTTLRVA